MGHCVVPDVWSTWKMLRIIHWIPLILTLLLRQTIAAVTMPIGIGSRWLRPTPSSTSNNNNNNLGNDPTVRKKDSYDGSFEEGIFNYDTGSGYVAIETELEFVEYCQDWWYLHGTMDNNQFISQSDFATFFVNVCDNLHDEDLPSFGCPTPNFDNLDRSIQVLFVREICNRHQEEELPNDILECLDTLQSSNDVFGYSLNENPNGGRNVDTMFRSICCDLLQFMSLVGLESSSETGCSKVPVPIYPNVSPSMSPSSLSELLLSEILPSLTIPGDDGIGSTTTLSPSSVPTSSPFNDLTDGTIFPTPVRDSSSSSSSNNNPPGNPADATSSNTNTNNNGGNNSNNNEEGVDSETPNDNGNDPPKDDDTLRARPRMTAAAIFGIALAGILCLVGVGTSGRFVIIPLQEEERDESDGVDVEEEEEEEDTVSRLGSQGALSAAEEYSFDYA